MKFTKILYALFIALIVIIGIALILTAIPNSRYSLKVVMSGSMEPAIHTGSVVMIAPSALYKQNDIITFQDLTDKKKTITHRIKDLEVVEGNIYYITKGDANDSTDARKVAQKEVIGKVIFSVPLVGYLVEAVRKPLGLFIIILIPALAIFFDEGRKIVREIKKIRASDKSENLDERI